MTQRRKTTVEGEEQEKAEFFFSSLHALGKMLVQSSFVQLHLFLGRPTYILPRGIYHRW